MLRQVDYEAIKRLLMADDERLEGIDAQHTIKRTHFEYSFNRADYQDHLTRLCKYFGYLLPIGRTTWLRWGELIHESCNPEDLRVKYAMKILLELAQSAETADIF